MVFLSLIGSFRGPPPGFVDVFPQFFCSLFHWVLLEFLLTVVFCWVKVSFAGPSPAPLGARLVFVFEFLSSVWIDACIAMSFPYLGPLLLYPRDSERLVVSSFSLVSVNFLNSSLMSWLTLSPFSRMVLNLHVFESLQTSCGWVLVSKHHGLKIFRGRSQSFGIS